MKLINQLIEEDQIVYVFTRLFDLHEKLKAEEVESAVLEGIHRATEKERLNYPERALTFVPFRDTAQDKITADNKTLVIYEEDLKRLKRCALMVGFFDGLSKDEGIGFELGYAYGKGLPIIAIFTDFMRREYKGVSGSEHITDPVILNMITVIVQEYNVVDSDNSFKVKLRKTISKLYRRLTIEVSEILSHESYQNLIVPSESLDVYLDFGGGQFEWERQMQGVIATELLSMGYSVQVWQRYNPHEPSTETDYQWVISRGRQDIDHLLSAKVVITCADMEEMSAGSAAIQGLARAMNKNVILVDTRSTDLVGDGTHRSSRNLMIDYSANEVSHAYGDVKKLVRNHLQ